MRNTCLKLMLSIAGLGLIASCEQAEVSPKPPTESAGPFHNTSSLADSQWLNERLADHNLHIVELGRYLEDYSEAHIPGAKFVDWRTDISDPAQPDRYNLPPRDQHEALLSNLGISEDSTIVLYDRLSSRAAVRMFWILKYYGHDDVRVLDGGINAWVSNNYVTSSEATETTRSNYRVPSVNSDLLVDLSYVSENLSSPGIKLVDGRPFGQYTGELPGTVFHTGVEHQRPGHIYGAESAPWADNLRDDGTFKSPAELIEIYAGHHVVNEGTVITYCNEGLHAAMPWFVLHEILGFDDVRLYDDSMAEWANTFDTPMITGEHCM